MSNCIMIERPGIYFTSAELDVENFMEQVMKHKDHDCFAKPESKACGIHPENWKEPSQANAVMEWGDCQMFFWYLTPTNVRIDGSQLTIALGLGKSAHTWRDLRGTLDTLNKFVKVYKRFVVKIKDVDDSQGWFTYNIVLGPGVDKHLVVADKRVV